MNNLHKIQNNLLTAKDELFEKYKIAELGIFGSYARGEEDKNSDLDILVEFIPQSKIDLFDYLELEEKLADLLQLKIDLVQKSGLKKRIAERILAEVIYL